MDPQSFCKTKRAGTIFYV